MQIVKGTPSHAKEMYEIEKESFSTAWSEISIEYEISQEFTICLLAIENEKILGHVYMRRIFDEGEIINIAVRKSHRNQGIGTFLMQGLLDTATAHNISKITLEVRINNTAAISLYKKFGFVAQGLRKDYYSQPVEDGVIMVRTISCDR